MPGTSIIHPAIALSLYISLFVIAGVGWSLILMGKPRHSRKSGAWVALALGIAAFLLTLRIQLPLQQELGDWGSQQGLPVLLYGFGQMLITGLVQESLKLLAILLPARFSTRQQSWLALGIAAGLGFGVWEACQLVALPLGYLGVLSPLAVFERVFAIAFHIATSVIMAAGYRRGRMLPYYLVAVISHALLNYLALFFHLGIVSIAVTEALIAAFSLLTFAGAYLLRRRISHAAV
ncbi:MAG: YhfC family glutamic-type intramembrane protease [Bacillota bacterium]|jgi:hypothetical protein